jgi:predicted transcriptional regulator
MRTKNYILFAALIANLILAWWVYDLTKEDQSPKEELLKSQGRVEILEEEVSDLKTEKIGLEVLNDSLGKEIEKKPKERVVIKKVYDEKINNVINLPLDSAVLFLSKGLSEIDYD